MTKFKNSIPLICSNVVFATCIYFGAYKGISGAMNILSFFTWFCFIISVLTFWNDEVQIIHYKKVKSRINYGIFEVLFDIACVTALVYYGHFLLGSIFTVVVLLQQYSINKGKELAQSSKIDNQ